MIRRAVAFIAAWLMLSAALCVRAQMYEMQPKMEVRVYPIDKTVSDLPALEDFSKPELAYAAMHRRLAAGNDDWRAVSVARLAPKLPPKSAAPKVVSERAAQGWLGTKIVEVRMVSDSNAYVIGQWPASGSFDVRGLELEGGRWLNVSDQQADTIEEARKIADDSAGLRRAATWWRKRTTYPQDYLKQFVEYLGRSTKPPRELVLQALADRKLVIIGEFSHRPTYWKLNADVVGDEHFPLHVGVIYLQLPSNGQDQVNRFLALDKLDDAPIVEMLRGESWMGCPDQSMLEFFEAVWNGNQGLPRDKHVRIVLVDRPLPWNQIRTPSDLKACQIDSDEVMAGNVLKDLQGHASDERHALLITGYQHAAKNLRLAANNEPIKTAGWRLWQAMPKDCYAFLQHGPQMSGDSKVYGRIARGLFDSAFRAADYKAVAFNLAGSPFGGEPFDASIDWESAGSFQDAFDGYIFLERLEDEWFSSVIEGFYTDEFVNEVDRRYRLIEDKGLDDGIGIDELTGRNFERWLSHTWGSPRDWKRRVGSIDAWQKTEGEEPPAQ